MRFNRIVVGIDFSQRSLAAAQWVAHHLSPDAQLVFVHVIPEPETPRFLRPHLTGALQDISSIAPALVAGLRGVADLVARGRHRVEIVEGIAADGLARIAADAGADLICLGRRRLRRGGARFGATTAHRLLARTRVPVLIVPGGDHAAPARILAALDSREDADMVVRGAARLAASWEARVDVVHVLSPHLRDLMHSSVTIAAGNVHGAIANGVESSPDLFRLTTEWLDQQADVAGIPQSHARACVSVGDPGHEIIRAAHLSRANLITMGRGMPSVRATPTDGLLPLGSTARHVMWAAPCPVLVLPTDSPTQRQPPTWRVTRMGTGQRSSPTNHFVNASVSDPLPPAAQLGVAVCDCCPTPRPSTVG
jgi:nucleotide-binding universal stress UspA family protein